MSTQLLAPVTQPGGLYPNAPARMKKPSKGSKINRQKKDKFQKRPELPPIAYHVTPYENPDNPPEYKRTGGRFWKVESERCGCSLHVWQHVKPAFFKAQDEGGHWVTLDNGEHVFIDDSGIITKGPSSLMGKPLSEAKTDKIETQIRTQQIARDPKTGQAIYDHRSTARFSTPSEANIALNKAATENGYRIKWDDSSSGHWGILDAPGKTIIHFVFNNAQSISLRTGSKNLTGDKEGLIKILRSMEKIGGKLSQS